MGKCDGCIFNKPGGCTSIFRNTEGECPAKMTNLQQCPGGKCPNCLPGDPCDEIEQVPEGEVKA